jgi:hypothetical protein
MTATATTGSETLAAALVDVEAVGSALSVALERVRETKDRDEAERLDAALCMLGEQLHRVIDYAATRATQRANARQAEQQHQAQRWARELQRREDETVRVEAERLLTENSEVGEKIREVRRRKLAETGDAAKADRYAMHEAVRIVEGRHATNWKPSDDPSRAA